MWGISRGWKQRDLPKGPWAVSGGGRPELQPGDLRVPALPEAAARDHQPSHPPASSLPRQLGLRDAAVLRPLPAEKVGHMCAHACAPSRRGPPQSRLTGAELYLGTVAGGWVPPRVVPGLALTALSVCPLQLDAREPLGARGAGTGAGEEPPHGDCVLQQGPVTLCPAREDPGVRGPVCQTPPSSTLLPPWLFCAGCSRVCSGRVGGLGALRVRGL